MKAEGMGLEPTPKSSGNVGYSKKRGTESGTVGAKNASFPPDLAVVVAAWPGLSNTVRRRVVQIIQATEEKGKVRSG